MPEVDLAEIPRQVEMDDLGEDPGELCGRPGEFQRAQTTPASSAGSRSAAAVVPTRPLASVCRIGTLRPCRSPHCQMIPEHSGL